MTYTHSCLVITGHVQFLKPEYNTVRGHFEMTENRQAVMWSSVETHIEMTLTHGPAHKAMTFFHHSSNFKTRKYITIKVVVTCPAVYMPKT